MPDDTVQFRTASPNLCEVYFLLGNFGVASRNWLPCVGSQPWSKSVQWCPGPGGWRFEPQGWVFEVNQLPDFQRRAEVLERNGGYSPTHIVRLTKPDGATFTPKDVDGIVDPIEHCLSLSQGHWCPAILPVGFDSSGTLSWQKHDHVRAEPYRQVQSILGADPLLKAHGKLLECFCRRWGEAAWAEALHEVIYWYLSANAAAAGIEAAIIITQTAIERLVFEELVNQRSATFSRNKFDKLKASERIQTGIQQISPESGQELAKAFPLLKQLAPGASWTDPIEAITNLRNHIVHPQRAGRGKFSDANVKAWEVGLWILEQLILRVIDYNGLYYKRLCPSDAAVSVPWIAGSAAATWLGLDLAKAKRLTKT